MVGSFSAIAIGGPGNVTKSCHSRALTPEIYWGGAYSKAASEQRWRRKSTDCEGSGFMKGCSACYMHLDSLAGVVLKNQCGLGLLAAEKGGLCLFLQEECFFFVNQSNSSKQTSKNIGTTCLQASEYATCGSSGHVCCLAADGVMATGAESLKAGWGTSVSRMWVVPSIPTFLPLIYDKR